MCAKTYYLVKLYNPQIELSNIPTKDKLSNFYIGVAAAQNC